MKPKEPDFSQHSRLSQHLSLLGLDENLLPPEATADEAKVMELMQPAPLRLPARVLPIARGPRRIWYLSSGLVAAAAALLILVQHPAPEQSPWTLKGGGSVQVYVEQGGHVQTLEKAEPLTPGDRIKAEVLSTTSGIAFWAVLDRNGKVLHDAQWIWDQRLILGPAERKSFSGSLQLDGPSEGENLCVAFCPAEALAHLDEGHLQGQVLDIMTAKGNRDKGSELCQRSCFPLRP